MEPASPLQVQVPSGTVETFYSYSHQDDIYREMLEKQLEVLHRNHLIEGWSDRRIMPREFPEWKGVIDEHLKWAHIILLLVSTDFLASDYCYDIEMTQALERHAKGEARVIPIILRPCLWRRSRFAHLQALPKDGRPVVNWRSVDDGLTNVAEGIAAVVDKLST